MPDLRFDADTHTYWVGERELPSVSKIIAPLVDLTMVPEQRLEFAKDRGIASHLACHLDDLGQLDESSVDEQHVLPRLMAWRKCKEENEIEIQVTEKPMAYESLGFAGTPDKKVRMRVKRVRRRAVLDLKNVAEMKPVIGVQLGGYELLLRHNGEEVDERFGVQLRGDGTYKLYSYIAEVTTFISLLSIYNWRMKNEPR